MSNRVIYNVEYDIPRVNLSLPGRQNRSGDGILRITPGMDEAFEFIFGNQDGVPLNLVPFKVKIVFWVKQDMDIDEMVPGQTKIVFGKELQEKYTILYYVTLILNKVQDDNLLLKIPPELQSTIDDILLKIETSQKFYGY